MNKNNQKKLGRPGGDLGRPGGWLPIRSRLTRTFDGQRHNNQLNIEGERQSSALIFSFPDSRLPIRSRLTRTFYIYIPLHHYTPHPLLTQSIKTHSCRSRSRHPILSPTRAFSQSSSRLLLGASSVLFDLSPGFKHQNYYPKRQKMLSHCLLAPTRE